MFLRNIDFHRAFFALNRVRRFVSSHKLIVGAPLLAAALIVVMLPLIGQGPLRERSEREHDSAQQIRKRAQWFFRQRAYPLNHIPAGARVRAVEHLERMRTAQGTFMQRILAHSWAAKSSRSFSTVVNAGARQIAINSSSWTPIGPAPTSSFFFNFTSGRVNALAVDPCDASGNTIYAGAAQGGLWKTADGGGSWTPLTDSQLSLSSGSIAVDPVLTDCTGGHTGAIYYGTGEENFAFDSFYGAGVLISHDGGVTWTKDNTFVNATSGTPAVIIPTNPGFAGPFIGSLAVKPGSTGSTQVLLAGIQGVSSPNDSGVYLSTNGGSTWAPVLPSSGMPAACDFGTGVVFDPNDPSGNTAYAALGIPFASGSGGSCGTEEQDNGVYKSTDGGNTWKLLSALDNAAQAVGGPARYGRITVAVGPRAGSSPAGELIVSIADIQNSSSSLLGLFQSTDGGNTFTLLMNDSSGGTAGTGFCDQQCFYDMSAAISPSNPNLIFLGGGPAAAGGATSPCGVFQANQGISTVIRSTDGGNSWADVSCDNTSGTFIHVDTHAFAFSPNGNLYTGNDGGVWASSDVINTGVAPGSQHWSDLNTTLNLTQFYPGISIHPSNPEIGFSGAQDNGAQIFNGSLNWTDTDACGDGGWTAIDPSTPSTIYAACAATGRGVVNKNQVDGTAFDSQGNSNWISIETPTMDLDNQNFIPPLVLDSGNPQNLYFGTFRVWQSMNGGISWNIVAPSATTGPGAQCAAGNACLLTTLAVAPNDSKTLYAGTDAGLMWVSTNVTSATPTFTEIDQSSTPLRTVTQIVVSPANSQVAFAAFSGFSGFADSLGHLFETTSGGASWMDISCHNAGKCGSPLTTDLPNTPVNDVVIDPDDVTNSTLYVATDVGVFATSNGGTSWSELASGLPHVECTSLKLDEAARVLRVGTHGRGDWDLQLPFAAGITSALTGISPSSTAVGSSGITLTLNGFGFAANPTVNFGSTPLTPSSASGTQITVNVPSSALASSGVVAVSVSGAQNSLNFSIENPEPGLNSVSPSTASASASTTLTISGTNFSANSEVIWTPETGTNAGVNTALTQNAGSLSCSSGSCVFTVTVPTSLVAATVADVAPFGAPRRGPQTPISPWFLAAVCIALLGIAMLFAFPRKRRALIGATLGIVFVLSLIGGCSNTYNNSPPIHLGNSVQVFINVLNPAPGGGMNPFTEQKTVTAQ